MLNFFNPGDPKFCRGVFLLSAYSCTLVGSYSVMIDFGPRAHCFTPIQKYINNKVDKFYQITPAELAQSNITKESKFTVSIKTIKIDK